MGRGIRSGRAGLSATALLLGSCAALGFGRPHATGSLETTLPPDIAAWLAAEACRAEHPGADPLPLHPGAPVLRHAEDDYEIRYNRAPPQGYRVFTNGRLVPPELEALREGGRPLPLTAVSFLAAPHASGHRAPGPDEVRIRIRATPQGSRIDAELSGAVAGGTLLQHLHRVFALAESIQDTANLVAEKRWAMARNRVAEAQSEFGPGCCGSHQSLRTRLLVHVATAAQAQGHLSAARTSTARALGLAPDTPGLRLWQADLDQRLALDREAATDWHILAASPASDGFCHAARLL